VSERSLWYDGTGHVQLIRNRHVTFESNSNRYVRFEFESRSFAGPYLNECLRDKSSATRYYHLLIRI